MSQTQSNIYIKIAYIGGGSRGWAHILMNDLAQCPDLQGEVRLYDIDLAAAQLNETFGNWIQQQDRVQSPWRYQAVENSGISPERCRFRLSLDPARTNGNDGPRDRRG